MKDFVLTPISSSARYGFVPAFEDPSWNDLVVQLAPYTPETSTDAGGLLRIYFVVGLW